MPITKLCSIQLSPIERRHLTTFTTATEKKRDKIMSQQKVSKNESEIKPKLNKNCRLNSLK